MYRKCRQVFFYDLFYLYASNYVILWKITYGIIRFKKNKNKQRTKSHIVAVHTGSSLRSARDLQDKNRISMIHQEES